MNPFRPRPSQHAPVWCAVLATCLSSSLLAQTIPSHRGALRCNGVVLQAKSREPLPRATVVTRNGHTAITDTSGYFSILTLADDTLLVSYLGYRHQVLPVAHHAREQDTIRVLLSPLTRVLPAVEVRPLTEQQFRQAFLELRLVKPRDTANLERNLDLMQYQGRYGGFGFFNQTMNAEDNHKLYLQGPRNGNILGLISIFGRMIRNQPMEGSYQHYRQYREAREKKRDDW